MDAITAADMLMFINAATTSTSQREFHGGADDQRLSLGFLHEYVIGNYRDLHAAALALDINDHNAALVYVADAVAAAFVVPHPDDYRALHTTLVQDLYGELVHHYATLAAPAPRLDVRLPDDVTSLADLRAAVSRQQAEWARFHEATMVDGLLGERYAMSRGYRMGDYTLSASCRRSASSRRTTSVS